MPLDLSQQENINSELNEFKTQVASVARRYAEQHGWCSVVDEALAEIGVEPTNGLAATVEIQVTAKVPVMISKVAELVGKSPEEQNALIAGWIAGDRPVILPSTEDSGMRYLSTHDVLPADQIQVLDVNQLTPEAAMINGVPIGHRRGFTSREGRVRHFVSDYNWERRYSTALCGVVASIRWQADSARDEGRDCRRCVERAQRRALPLQTVPAQPTRRARRR